jgi:RimJ/RimL family protein N-acetyltransferase
VGAVIWFRDDATGEIGTSASASAPSDAEKASSNDAINSPSTFTTGQPLRSEWGTAIGVVHLSHLTPNTAHHRRTDIGISILPAYQGRGYGREAIEWALDYAFRRAGLHRVRVRAFEWNAGALRLYEEIGLKIEGREREAFWHEGRWWDGVDMGMLEGEWWDMRREREAKEKGK